MVRSSLVGVEQAFFLRVATTGGMGTVLLMVLGAAGALAGSGPCLALEATVGRLTGFAIWGSGAGGADILQLIYSSV
jgi:hypothetical protein